MLQPDKLKKLNENASKMAENGSSQEEILAMRDAFIKQFGNEEPLKKKDVTTSTSTIPTGSTDSEQTNGSSAFPQPKYGQELIVEESAKVPPSEADLNLRKKQLQKELSTVKVTPKNMDEVTAKTDELARLQKAEIAKKTAVDKAINDKIFTVDTDKLAKDYQEEATKNQGVMGMVKQGGLNVLNAVVTGMNKLGFIDEKGDSELEQPFTDAKIQADKLIAQEKKRNPNYKPTQEQYDKAVKDIYIKDWKQKQFQENAKRILGDTNPEVQERLKLKQIDDIGELSKNGKAISVQIQSLDNVGTGLRRQLIEGKKLMDAGKLDPQGIQSYQETLQKYNDVEKQYQDLIQKQKKNIESVKSAEDRLKIFTLDYNPYHKAISDVVLPTERMVGEGLYAMGKASDKLAEAVPMLTGGVKDKSIFTNLGNSIIDYAEGEQAKYPQQKLTDIKNFSDFGKWTTQTIGNVIPYAVGTAIGTTEEQALSKAFLTPSKALTGFSIASAGGSMREMDKELAENKDLDYNNWQYMAKVIGSVGANAVMFGNYGRILKDNKALFQSIGKSPEANVEFQKGVKDYLNDAFKEVKEANKSGLIMAGSNAINMFVDNEILGKKHDNNLEELANSYLEGGAMHALISSAPKGAMNLGTYMLEKVVPNQTKLAIKENLQKGFSLMKELENPDLTPEEKSKLQSQLSDVHKANENLLKASSKQTESLTKNQIKELLTIDQDKFAITKDVEEIKNGNYSRQYKENALKDLKIKFNELEGRRQDVFQNEHNALTLLPKSEQNRLEKEAKIKIADKEGKEVADVKFEPKKVNDVALEIHKSELKSQENAEIETEVAKTPSVESAVEPKPSERIAEIETKQGYDLEKIADIVGETKIKQDSRPNKGDLVDFGEGLENIIDIVKIKDKEYIQSVMADGSSDRKNLYPVNQWENIISKQNEYAERRKDVAERQIERQKEAELKAKKQADLEAEFNDISGFAEDKTKIQKGKILQHLNKKIYGTTIKKELQRVSELPHRFIDKEGKKRIVYKEKNGDEFLLSDVYTTKTGLEYFDYLINKEKPTETRKEAENVKVSEGKGSWRSEFNKTNDISRKNTILETLASSKTSSEQELRDVYKASIKTETETNRINNALLENKNTPKDIFYEIVNSEKIKKTNSDEAIKIAVEKRKEIFPNKKETRKEARIKIADAKIDDFANALKDLLPKGADLSGLKKQGLSQDDIIDIIAKGAKELAKTGIEIDEAIRQVISKLKEHFEDLNVEVKDVLDKHFVEPVITDKDGNKYTSLKKAVYDAEREAQGKEVVDTRNKKSPTEVRNEVESKIKSGEITEQEIRDIATAIAKGEDIPTKISKEELQYALLHDKVTLEKGGRKIDSDLEKAFKEKDHEKQAELIFKKAQNETLLDDNYLASKITGSEASRILNAKKAGLDEDYSYRTILDRVQEMSKGAEVPQETKDRLKKMSDEITDLQSKIDDYEARFKQHEEEVKKLEEEKAQLEEKVSKSRGEEKLEKLKKIQTTKEYKKAELDKKKKDTINSIKEKYRRLSGTLNAGVNLKLLELAPEISALAKLYVIDEPAIKLEELMGKMLVELKDAIPDLTERDLRDIFSGYGKSVKPSENELAKTLAELKSKARALSGLEDVKELGIAPAKSGISHRPPTEEVLALRREIQREMRERGIDVKNTKNPEDVWKTALDSYKTKIKNRIEYLENISKTNDVERYIREKKKTKLKLDDEARDLKRQQQKIKNNVDDMVAKADFETWSKYRKALHYSGRYAKGVLISSPITLVKILGSVGWRLAYKPLHSVSMYGASKAFPKLAETQGINTRKDLADHLVDYYSTAFSKENIKDLVTTFRQHESPQDVLFGKHYANVPLPETKGNKELNVAQKVFFKHLKFLENINASSHGALKNLVSLPEYTAWKNTILRNLIREGIPPELMENGTAEQIAHQLAFLKGQRAKFMQKNIVAEQQTALEARLRNKGLHGTAEAINFILPIVKIGSNYVGEALEKQPGIGLIPNSANLLKARETLTEKQKSDLLRTLSYQGVGAASFLMGAMLYQNISPFYGTKSHQFAKKNGKDLPEEDETLGFLDGVYTHAPDAVNMRAGATFMWYWDMYDKAYPNKNSMMKFMGSLFNREIVSGIVSQSPYISASEGTIAPLLNSKSDLGKAEANFLRSRLPFGDFAKTVAEGQLPIFNKLAPESGKELAKKLGLKPEEVKLSDIGLYPKGLWQNIQLGVPGWRDDALKEMYEEKYGIKAIYDKEMKSIEEEMKSGEKDMKKEEFLKEHSKK